MSTEFERNQVAALISAAQAEFEAKREADEKAEKATKARELEIARNEAAKLSNAKALVTRFSQNKLEPMFRKVQGAVQELGHAFIGGFVEEHADTSGIAGRTLEAGKTRLSGLLHYGRDKGIRTAMPTC